MVGCWDSQPDWDEYADADTNTCANEHADGIASGPDISPKQAKACNTPSEHASSHTSSMAMVGCFDPPPHEPSIIDADYTADSFTDDGANRGSLRGR